jgi:ribosomal protein S12 methylthiotransferase accessory factor
MDRAPIQLMDAYKQSTVDQDKVLAPEETIRSVREKFSRTGLDILAETVRIDNGRLDIPVFFSVCGDDAKRLTGTAKQMGKGATPAQAEASAVMELAERFSVYAFSENPENFIVATYANVRDHAIPFELIARSVNDREALGDASKEIFSEIPLKWTWGSDLTNGRPVLVPFDWFFAINAFNGTSAGNCREEALCQGICEIVERHVSARICTEKIPVPAIDPCTAADPVVREMLSKYEKERIELYISDFTLDMGIPTVGVLAFDPATHPEKSEIVWTAGTTPDPEKALSRALSETAQLGGDFNSGSNYVASGLPKFHTMDEARYITHPPETVALSDLPDISSDNIRIEIENCVAALAKKDMPVITIETTQEMLSIPSFYTVIPGTRFQERAAATSVAMFCGKLVTEKFPPGEAIEKLSGMEKKLPGKYYIQFYLGLCRLDSGDAEGALAGFESALDLDPDPQDVPSIYSYTGVCLKELGAYEKALSALEKGLSWDSERTDLHNLKGYCLFKLGRYRQAIESFSQVLRLNPNSAIDYANIATNYRELGQSEKAAAYYRIALEIDPGIEFARENLRKLEAGF